MVDLDTQEVQDIVHSDKSKADRIDQLLELGVTKRQCLSLGFKEPTIRARINKRKEDGLPIAGSESSGSELERVDYPPAVLRGTEHISTTWMAQRMAHLVDGDEKMRDFAEFLLSIPLFGLDILAQMSKHYTMVLNAAKGESTKELIEALKRGDQVASDAALEAATLVAAQSSENQKRAAVASSSNPMQAMFMNALSPYFEQTIGKIFGGVLGGNAPQQSQAPSGWQKESK